MALRDLEAGEPVVRYGETIGLAARAIRAGSWVREEMVELPPAPALDRLPLATAVPAPLPPLEGFTFEGYPNPDGSVGTRNILGIATTVQCVAPTVDYAVRRIKAELLPRFPNVDDAVAITHNYGCGVAIDAPGRGGADPDAAAHQPARQLGGHAAGGQPGMRETTAAAAFEGTPRLAVLEEGNVVRLQDASAGFGETVAAILRAAERRLGELNRRARRTCPAADAGGGAAVRRERRVLRA